MKCAPVACVAGTHIRLRWSRCSPLPPSYKHRAPPELPEPKPPARSVQTQSTTNGAVKRVPSPTDTCRIFAAPAFFFRKT